MTDIYPGIVICPLLRASCIFIFLSVHCFMRQICSLAYEQHANQGIPSHLQSCPNFTSIDHQPLCALSQLPLLVRVPPSPRHRPSQHQTSSASASQVRMPSSIPVWFSSMAAAPVPERLWPMASILRAAAHPRSRNYSELPQCCSGGWRRTGIPTSVPHHTHQFQIK